MQFDLHLHPFPLGLPFADGGDFGFDGRDGLPGVCGHVPSGAWNRGSGPAEIEHIPDVRERDLRQFRDHLFGFDRSVFLESPPFGGNLLT